MNMPKHKKKDIIWNYLDSQTKSKDVNVVNLTLNEMKKQFKNDGITEKDILEILNDFKNDNGCVKEEDVKFTIYFPNSSKKNIPKFFVDNFVSNQEVFFVIISFMILSFLVLNDSFFMLLSKNVIGLEKSYNLFVLQELYIKAMFYGSLGVLILGVLLSFIFNKLKDVILRKIPSFKTFFSKDIGKPFIYFLLFLILSDYFLSFFFGYNVTGNHFLAMITTSFIGACMRTKKYKI